MFNTKNLWEIKKNTTELFDFDTKVKEELNCNNLKKIIKSGYNKTYTDAKWLEEFHVPFSDLQGHLKKLKKEIRNGFLVTHAQVPQGYGRANYKGFVSMSQLPNAIRQALSIGTTTDYDIKNAQPQILFEICKMNKIPKEEIKYQKKYCEDRDGWLKEIGEYYFGEYNDKIRKMCKVLIIQVAYFGGGFNSWYKNVEENGFVLTENKKHDNHFITKLKKEIECINNKYIIVNNSNIFSDIVIDNEKQFKSKMEYYEKNKNKDKKLKKPFRKNPKSTILSKFLHQYERICIEIVINKLTEMKKMIRNRYIYTFDGFQDKEHDCELLNKIVKEEIGFNIEFIIKDCNEGIELMKEVDILLKEDLLGKKHPSEFVKEFNTEYLESLCYDFEMQKSYWELFCCFTQKDGNYWFSNIETLVDPETQKVREKRETQPYKWCKLQESFGDIPTYTQDKNGEEKRIPFIQKWRMEGMRKYYKMDFYPENKKHEDMIEGKYFNTFNGYPDFVFDEEMYSEEESKTYKKIWEGLLSNLVGSKLCMTIFNMIISYKIKYPSRKKPFGIIIKGLQGEGKNFILSRIAQVIAKHHYNTTSNVEDVLGKHAMGLFHKLIVNLNEMNLTDTKDKTERFKSLISENSYTFNPKNAQPFEAIIYALLIVTTNKMCPLVLDVMTGERRWFIFEGNGRNCRISQDKWAEIFRLTETDKFTQWLYNYYNNMDCENYDFKHAKYENSKTEAYNNVASLFIPYELLFMKDWIIDCSYLNYTNKCMIKNDLDGDSDDEDGVWKRYYEHEEFYQEVEVEVKSLLRDFWDWSKENRCPVGETKNPKSFKAKISSFNFKNIEYAKDKDTRRATMKFKTIDIMKQLIEKNVYDDNIDNWKKLDKEGMYKKEDEKTGLGFLDLL